MKHPGRIPELDAMIDHAAAFVVERFAKAGEIPSMWIAETKAGEHMAVPDLFDTKTEQLAFLRAVFREHKVVRFVAMMEAWILDSRDLGGGPIPDAGASLEHHPDRREVVMLQAEDREHCALARFYILRPEHGPPTLSPLYRSGTMDRFEGRMTGLLR